MARTMVQRVTSRVFFVIVLVLGVFIGRAAVKEMERGQRIADEVAALNAEAGKIQKDNAMLKDRIGYLQTDAFQQQEAKKKLNYQSPDENVVVIKQTPDASRPEVSPQTSTLPEYAPDLLPNYKKWWNQIFHE